MKIKLEDLDSDEIEVIIRGDIADDKIQHLISLLKSTNITSKILLQAKDKEILVDINEIMYFETIDRKNYACTVNEKLVTKYSLNEILLMYKSRGITQIGKSLLVNVNYVKFLEAEFSGNYTLTLKNEEKLLISRFYMKDFRNTIMEV